MFTKDQLVLLRNLTLALHASSGHLITIPTEGAIAGEADETTIRLSMMALIIEIQLDIVHITQNLNLPDVASAFTAHAEQLQQWVAAQA